MDIIQAPKSMRLEDFPSVLKVNEPFEIDGVFYVLELSYTRDLGVCASSDQSETTTVPEKAKNYYVIKKLLT